MEEVSDDRFRTVITEQLLLPNTKDRFSGFLFLIPKSADKGTSAVYLLDLIKKAHPNEQLHVFCFGDALVDVPLLTINYPGATIQSFGLHLTAQAQLALAKMENIRVVSYFDSAPQRIWRVLSSQIKNHIDPQPTSQNSPYRRIIKPFEFIIDRFAPQEYTPDEITEYGTQLVNDGVQKLYDFHGGQGKKLSGYRELLKGYLMDIVDGVRARNSPHLKTEQGYLLDVLADRKKEFALLYARSQINRHSAPAAISCILPSIARAQAECMGVMVPEHDARGGSALSRSARLLTIAFLDLLQLTHVANTQTQHLLDANIATYAFRASLTDSFSPKHQKNYDQAAFAKYEALVQLLAKQWKELQKHKLTSQMPENVKKTVEKYIDHL
jgi:phosphatidylglycerophosphate synthase